MADQRLHGVRASDSDLPRHISHQLVTLMHQHGYDEDDLSRRCGVSVPTIRRIVEMEASPGIVTLDSLATGLGVHITDFFPKKAGRGAGDVNTATMFVADKMGQLSGRSLAMLLRHIDEYVNFLLWKAENGGLESQDRRLDDSNFL